MPIIADLHIHSRYSRATSKSCSPETLDCSGRQKGLHLIGTGDFTHPAWRSELKEKLIPAEEGLYRLKQELVLPNQVQGSAAPRFVLSSEISCIYKKGGRTRKVHHVILLPSIAAADALSHKLEAIGNLHSDGRPILGMDSRDLLELTLDTCPEAIFIPAHIWTPHFSLFGANSGFDRIEECFEDLTPFIRALETGLSSDPAMNWRLSALDNYTLVSNSDAHSPANLAREANLLNIPLSYPALRHALAHPETQEFLGTLEFFPEEGKYHFDGHRNCNICLSPEQSIANGNLCPVCGRRLTIGVAHRAESLADHPPGRRAPYAKHFESILPLSEAIGSCLGHSPSSQKVQSLKEHLLWRIGPELYILREAPLEQLREEAGPLVFEGMRRLRRKEVCAQPGYDGVYGKIQLLTKEERSSLLGQLSFFTGISIAQAKKTSAKKARIALPTEPAFQPAPEPQTAQHSLNTQQQHAVSCIAQTTAVIAGPGTGKTHTLIRKIVSLIEQEHTPASRIMAVTFTNQAAAEMRSRLSAALGRREARSITIGTFHSICLELLKKSELDAPVLPEEDALLLGEQIVHQFGLKLSPAGFLRRVSSIKNGALPATSLPQKVLDAYADLLDYYGVMDYDDILLRAIEHLKSQSANAKQQLHAFSHLLVDEFQDINPLQYCLIRLIKDAGASLFCIGDPNQSIYGFRGADAACFTRLAQDYPDLLQITLRQNYRSTPEILCSARPVVQEESLQATRPAGIKVQIVQAQSALSEGICLAHEIMSILGGIDMLGTGSGKKKRAGDTVAASFSDIAVLYRTHRQAEIIENCLKKEGIPYIVLGREDFLSDCTVQYALNFFRLLLEPLNLLALHSCLQYAGGRPQQIQEILLQYRLGGYRLELLPGLLQPLGDASFQKFSEMLFSFSEKLKKEDAATLLHDWAIQQDIENNPAFDRLIYAAAAQKDLTTFLAQLTLGQEPDIRRSGSRAYPLDAVTLSTIHGAKGREFSAVFLCGINRSNLPLQASGIKDLEEERRLFYVGMTRAKELLTISYFGEPSPFLAELPSAFSETRLAAPHKKILAEQLRLF